MGKFFNDNLHVPFFKWEFENFWNNSNYLAYVWFLSSMNSEKIKNQKYTLISANIERVISSTVYQVTQS